jgi:hypothetical protein
MPSYSEMRARIADELANDGAITAAQINYAIQDAIKHYERREWWFNSNIGTFNTVASQELYTATDWPELASAVQIDAMTVTYNTVKSPMRAVSYVEIDDRQTGFVLAVPRNFAYYDQALRLFPIPNGAYPITVSYARRFTSLSDDDDTNAWTTEAEELIRQAAKSRIAANYLQADDLAARFGAMEQRAYANLLQEKRNRQTNKLLRTSIMLNRPRFNILTG